MWRQLTAKEFIVRFLQSSNLHSNLQVWCVNSDVNGTSSLFFVVRWRRMFLSVLLPVSKSLTALSPYAFVHNNLAILQVFRAWLLITNRKMFFYSCRCLIPYSEYVELGPSTLKSILGFALVPSSLLFRCNVKGQFLRERALCFTFTEAPEVEVAILTPNTAFFVKLLTRSKSWPVGLSIQDEVTDVDRSV